VSQIKSLKDVVDWGLCTGCGACYYACSEAAVSLVNIESVGIRPQFNSSSCLTCTKCLSICPGNSVDASVAPINSQGKLPDVGFGDAIEIWEGHATDPEIRYRASSGGIITALALYCLEQENMAFALHAAMNGEKPWENETVISRTRDELVSRSGSRYAPASPCDRLGEIEQSDKPCVFIGKPCDVAAVSMLRRERPVLNHNLGLVLTFFCAGTPSSEGTLSLAKAMNVLPETINAIRYRGEGWPGRFKVAYDEGRHEQSLSYADSWGELTHFRSLRCNLCPDGLGRLGDISCGDAWENSSDDGNPGLSLVIVRTSRGQQILQRAMAAKYVTLRPALTADVVAAQQSLLRRRTEIFGRFLGLRIFGAPVPTFKGFSLMRSWWQLSLVNKVRTVFGTARRVAVRRLYVRRPADSHIT
jgi:coenzyme F420 hydrogenase subunit beta